MLGLGLMLFCLRALKPGLQWKERPTAIAFWSVNLGLAAMVLLSMFPVGLMHAWASVEFGTWYARSAEFLQTPLVTRLRWMRMLVTLYSHSARLYLDGSYSGSLPGIHSRNNSSGKRQGAPTTKH
jgi:nitric oxide reductase large subunit